MELAGGCWSLDFIFQIVQVGSSTSKNAADCLRGIEVLVEGREWHHTLSGSDRIVKLQRLVDYPKALLSIFLTMLSVDDLISACKEMIFACKSIFRS